VAPSTPPVAAIKHNVNYARYLGKALASKTTLDVTALETIVVDGGSTHGSVELIRN
jgi:glycosyltransferase involved in cell wall biosynthesis